MRQGNASKVYGNLRFEDAQAERKILCSWVLILNLGIMTLACKGNYMDRVAQ